MSPAVGAFLCLSWCTLALCLCLGGDGLGLTIPCVYIQSDPEAP